MSRTIMIESMRCHQRRSCLKAELMATDPHCSDCGCELVAKYGPPNSAIVVDGKLACVACVEERSKPKPKPTPIPRPIKPPRPPVEYVDTVTPQMMAALRHHNECPECRRPIHSNRIACLYHVEAVFKQIVLERLVTQ